MDINGNPATRRPNAKDRYEDVAKQRRREEALARRKANVTVDELAQDAIQSPPDMVL